MLSVGSFSALKRQGVLSSSASTKAVLPAWLLAALPPGGALGLGFEAGPGAWVLTVGRTDSLCFLCFQGCLSLLFCGRQLLWAAGTDLACCWRRLLASNAAALASTLSVRMAG